MSLSSNKIILAGANLQTNTAGAYFQNANITVNSAGANLNIAIPAGWYYANTPSNCTIYANVGSSTNVSVLAANLAGLIWADGENVYANTTTNGTLVLITVNSGQNVGSTFA